ncbi:hypothetical protein [Reichenbachiella versicolor]|uniref:hypothetical protein n=1 Tax=Reichenbachiella versicolor TaxID=1821036 RepID=UPI000D6E08F8|nr:hypothetical protein [Reichenbachiella versicolor]
MIKKLLLLSFLVISALKVVVAEQGWKEKKATYYATQAAQEFMLTEEQKSAVYKYKFSEYSEFGLIVKKNKEGGFINEEDFKKTKSDFWKGQKKKLAIIVGVEPKELNPFLNRMRTELPKI